MYNRLYEQAGHRSLPLLYQHFLRIEFRYSFTTRRIIRIIKVSPRVSKNPRKICFELKQCLMYNTIFVHQTVVTKIPAAFLSVSCHNSVFDQWLTYSTPTMLRLKPAAETVSTAVQGSWSRCCLPAAYDHQASAQLVTPGRNSFFQLESIHRRDSLMSLARSTQYLK